MLLYQLLAFTINPLIRVLHGFFLASVFFRSVFFTAFLLFMLCVLIIFINCCWTTITCKSSASACVFASFCFLHQFQHAKYLPFRSATIQSVFSLSRYLRPVARLTNNNSVHGNCGKPKISTNELSDVKLMGQIKSAHKQ